MSQSLHKSEVSAGERFAFGENWANFLRVLDDNRIAEGKESLRKMLGLPNLAGKSFLDIGSGSGMFSLAARQLGAQVHSFDYDPDSVKCTQELRRRYFTDDPAWLVEEGSVLDPSYLGKLGEFDVVYSWGVLHHTGKMWEALQAVVPKVADGGMLFIAIYNDEGKWSRRWLALKRIYNRLPGPLKTPYAVTVMGARELRFFLGALLKFRLFEYLRGIRDYRSSARGMSYWHDLKDWIGGYPFEVATPEAIFDFFHGQGFELTRLTTDGGLGCNQYVFKRTGRAAASR